MLSEYVVIITSAISITVPCTYIPSFYPQRATCVTPKPCLSQSIILPFFLQEMLQNSACHRKKTTYNMDIYLEQFTKNGNRTVPIYRGHNQLDPLNHFKII